MNSTSNHDPAELSRFEAHAQRWWDPEGEFRPLHELNPVRLAYVADRVTLAGSQVLDVGCGGGLLSEAMALRGAVVTGLDLGPTAIEVARLHAFESGASVTYRVESVEAHAQQHAARYDTVTCMEMLEHVPDPLSVLQSIHTLVKPGGHVFLSTVNRNLKAYALAIVAGEYLMNLLPRGTHSYERFIRPSELARALRNVGFKLVDIAGIEYNPVTRSAKVVSDVAVNYVVHAKRQETAP